MSAILPPRRNIRTVEAKKAAEHATSIRPCPRCGNESRVIERYATKEVYQCTSCNAINTFRRKLGQKDKRHTEGINPGVIVRDRSKEEKDDKEITEELPKEGPILDVIRSGMQDCQLVSFKYVDRNGNKSARSVEPYKIERNKKGEIILFAYCPDSQGIRVFKFKSMQDVNQVPKCFEPRWGMADKLKKED